jgi:protein SCO1/2
MIRFANALPFALALALALACLPASAVGPDPEIASREAGAITAEAPTGGAASESPSEGRAIGPYARIGLDQKPGAQVDLSLPFRDENGDSIDLARIADGRPLLLVPSYFRCPMLCSYVLAGLAQGLDGISPQPGRDYRVAAVSIDPAEGPSLAAAKKRTYLARIGRDPGAAEGWRFLTGSAASIAALTASVGFRYAYDSAIGEYAHPAAVIALTPEGRVSRYFPGAEFPPRDLRLGLAEASRGRVGGLAGRVYLACYRYDPVTGRYAPLVRGGLRILAILVAGSLIFAGVAMERKGRKRAYALARPGSPRSGPVPRAGKARTHG